MKNDKNPDEMRPTYDFKNAERGRHAARYKAGVTLNGQLEVPASPHAAGAVFNIADIRSALASHNRYEHRLSQLTNNGQYTQNITATVDSALANVERGSRSFVIYGDPQSGKTEMMIALTARLLDSGHRIVVVLLNDNVQLLMQNLSRFRSAGLDPAPKHFDEILHDEISLARGEWIIFCKKNSHDLTKLIEKMREAKDHVVILDDEADFATPNARVNQPGIKTRINELVETLLGSAGIYIGVTATPARLNLNKTFNNETERWVLFPPHPNYIGNKVFFPVTLADASGLPFNLVRLPDIYDDPKFLRAALLGFLVNVAHLNTAINDHELNYSMLIHTSGKRVDHSNDYKQVVKIYEVLSNPENPKFESYVEQVFVTAESRYPGEGDTICKYILRNVRRHVEVVMNSNRKTVGTMYEAATKPQTPFTIAIGGNIVSRGVTFENLLSMFFTRDVKHRIQQDTYIQRARMFGSRGPYLRYFDLSIPEKLYNDWHRCFVFHNLALEAIKREERSPVWIEDKRIAAVSPGSIDRATVNMDSGEMSWQLFRYDEQALLRIINDTSTGPLRKLELLQALIGPGALPQYLLDFIRGFLPKGEKSIAIHSPGSIAGYSDAKDFDRDNIIRKRGFMGTSALSKGMFADASHHLRIFHNGKGNARVFYKYVGSVTFMKQKPLIVQ
jgi:hypothetical protein